MRCLLFFLLSMPLAALAQPDTEAERPDSAAAERSAEPAIVYVSEADLAGTYPESCSALVVSGAVEIDQQKRCTLIIGPAEGPARRMTVRFEQGTALVVDLDHRDGTTESVTLLPNKRDLVLDVGAGGGIIDLTCLNAGVGPACSIRAGNAID